MQRLYVPDYRPSKEKKPPSPRYPQSDFRNGAVPNGRARGVAEKPTTVPPGVWTANPSMFVGVPSQAYNAVNGTSPNYSNGVNGRAYTSNPDLTLERRRPAPPVPIQSQPDLRNSEKGEVSKQFNITDEEPRRKNSEIILEANSKLFEQGTDGTARVFSNYSDVGGPTSKPKTPNHPNTAGPEKYVDPFVARVVSDYPPSQRNSRVVSDETGENVARAFNRYYGGAPGTASPEKFVAKAIVRTSDVALADGDLDNNSAAVFIPHSDWDITEIQKKPAKPVVRTQSNMEKTSVVNGNRGFQDHQPRVVSGEQNRMGYRNPYVAGVYLNRAPSDATMQKKGTSGSKDKKDKGSSKGSDKGSSNTKGSGEKRRWWSKKPSPKPDEQVISQTAQRPASHQIPQRPGVAHAKPVQRSMSDASMGYNRPLPATESPKYPAAQQQQTWTSQVAAANFGEDEIIEPKTSPSSDPHALYARPSKIKRNPQEKRQIDPEERSPPPLPPPPLPLRTADDDNQVTVKAVIENMEENKNNQTKPRGRHMSVSSDHSVDYAKAGKVVSEAFNFLDDDEL